MARPDVIELGYSSEFGARPYEIDIGDLVAKWPGAVPLLEARRPREKETYKPAGVVREDDRLIWTPDAYDTHNDGRGSAQVHMMDAAGELLGMSEIMDTIVEPSLGAGQEQEWQPELAERIEQAAGQAMGAALACERAAGRAETAAGDVLTGMGGLVLRVTEDGLLNISTKEEN